MRVTCEMTGISIFIVFVLAGSACIRTPSGPLDWLGQDAPKETSPIGAVHKGGTHQFHYIEFKGIKYLIEIDTMTEKVVAIEPFSKNFVTPEEIGLGNLLQEAISAGGILDPLRCEVRFPSGWIAEASQINYDLPCEDQLD
jgi:hypothetical protein